MADPFTSDAALILRARGGDELAFRRLLDRHRDLIERGASKYFSRATTRDDFQQEAMYGFHKAICYYRPDRGSGFRNFAELCIERQVITTLKTARRQKHSLLNDGVSLSKPILTSDGEGTLADVIPDRRPGPLGQLLAAEEISELSAAIRERLTDLECAALIHFANGLDYDAIAAQLGTHYKAIDNALRRARQKLAETPGPSPRTYKCPSCGGPTCKRRHGAGRPPRCVVCRVTAPSFSLEVA